MTFTSLSWVALMAATAGFYWLLPARVRGLFLALVSIIFLASIEWRSALFLCIFTCVSYVAAHQKFISKLTIAFAVAVVACSIGYFKAQVQNDPMDIMRDVAMPIGMSYYAFRVIHYLIDKYRKVLPEHNFYDYICYLFFLPTLLVGPIHRFQTFRAERKDIRWSASDLSEGLERILIGYFKIIVLGNFFFSKYLTQKIRLIDPQNEGLILYLDAARGSLNLYFQFSGYSHVAIGFALLLGYRVMENFDNPFMKTNISDFWRSWHISLTSWSRDYIYMTAVGLTRNPYIGTLVSLIAIGVWHELSPRYVLWGLYHGLGIIVVNKFQQYKRKRRKRLGLKIKKGPMPLREKAVGIFLTANYFFFGYIIINQGSIGRSIDAVQTILFFWM